MCETEQGDSQFKWVLKAESNSKYVLARCGVWEALVPQTVYSKGQIIILLPKSAEKPAFLGEMCKSIPQRNNAIRLIEEVAKAMVEALPDCSKVYLASLNEGALGLHFWLVPRNRSEHKGYLDQRDENGEEVNDGFALLSKLRGDFVERKKKGIWGTMPPEFDENWEGEWNDAWRRYAQACLDMFKRWHEKIGSVG
jgi:hypothetical protein